MSSKKYLLLFLLFLPIVSAQENFKASSSQLEIELCSCAATKDTIIIENTGTSTSIYSVTAQKISEWSTIQPENFILEPGQKAKVTNLISPPCGITGEYDFSVVVTTSLGLQKSFQQKLVLDRCVNIGVDIINYSLSNCACVPTTYQFLVSNTNGYTEIYDFDVKQFSEYTEITPSHIALKANSTVPVFVTVTPPCDADGILNLTFNAFARTSKFLAKTPFFLTVKSCYDYDLDIDELFELCERVKETRQVEIENKADAINTYTATITGAEWIALDYKGIRLSPSQKGIFNISMDPPLGSEEDYEIVFKTISEKGEVLKNKTFEVRVDNCYDFFVDIVKDKDTICCGEHSYEVQIKNKGSLTTEFALEVNQNWAELSQDEIEIEPGRRAKLNLDVNPVCRDKSYDVTVKAYVPEYEYISSDDTITLNVLSGETCYNLELQKGKARIFYKDQSSLMTFKNKGLAFSKYEVSLLDAPSWVYLNTTTIEIPLNKIGSVYLYTTPDAGVLEDTYTADILFEVPEEDISYVHSVFLNLKAESIVMVKLKAFFDAYSNYVVIGVIILVLLIILFNVVMKVRERKLRKKIVEEKKKVKKVKKPISRFWKTVLTIIIILAVIIGGFLIYYYTIYQPPVARNVTGFNMTVFAEDMSFIFQDAKDYVISLNITQFVVTEEEPEEEFEEEIPETFLYQYLEQGKTKEIDLASHIIDPDGDELFFTSIGQANIDVKIEKGVAYLTPEKGSVGESLMIFNGNDMEGGSVSVNITLIVKESTGVSYYGAETYLDYVIIGFVLLVIILGILRGIEEVKEKSSKKK